jgi:histidine ammonia-lyase
MATLAPYLPIVNELRPCTAQGRAAAGILAELEGSYLWEPSSQRALQDPLSFRTASHILDVAEKNVGRLKEMLAIQINSSDDNPASIPGIAPPPDVSDQVRSYYVTTGAVRGAVIPTANFEPLPLVVPLESLGVALGRVSGALAARTGRLGTPEFTHLSRFLAPDDNALAYSAVQKVYAALDLENQELSNPVSRNPLPIAGDIEDVGTNSATAAQRVLRIVDNLYYVLGLELMMPRRPSTCGAATIPNSRSAAEAARCCRAFDRWFPSSTATVRSPRTSRRPTSFSGSLKPTDDRQPLPSRFPRIERPARCCDGARRGGRGRAHAHHLHARAPLQRAQNHRRGARQCVLLGGHASP